MPMPAKGPHLALRRRKGRPDTWVIRDSGKVELATGTGDRGEAEIALAAYIADKHAGPVVSGPATPETLTLGEVLAIYGEEHAPHVAAPERIGYAIAALLPFWGALPVSAITKETCRRYFKDRAKSDGTMRRELGVLQAAINYCVDDGRLTAGRKVLLPEKPEPKQRALTRDEVAKLLRAARRSPKGKHLAHFILVSLYTGTRKAAVLNLRLAGPYTAGGWFDLAKGLLHRKGEEERGTKKRRPVVRVPRQLIAHARRWQRRGDTWAVEYCGRRVANVQHAWELALASAGLDWRPTLHSFKHTAITWGIAGGMSVEDAATFYATSPQTIMNVYWDKSPHFQAGAVEAVERMGRRK